MKTLNFKHNFYFSLRFLFTLLLSMTLMSVAIADKEGKTFDFAVIGDTGYTKHAVSVVEKLFDTQLNKENLAFIVHVGDIGSVQRCTQAGLNIVKNMFQSSKNPVVYTPGDNEWTDC